jgi:hypothetical protein
MKTVCDVGNIIYLDDIQVKLQTCDSASSLIVNAISSSGATLDWTSNDSEAAWNLRYKKTADANYNEIQNTTIKPYPLTGLNPNTEYVWNIQAVCNISNSNWSEDNTFYTLDICNAPTLLTSTAISESGATLGWTANNSESAWNIRYKKASEVLYNEISNTALNPYTLNGLEQNTAYTWSVQAICTNNTSVWTSDSLFSTTNVGLFNNSLNSFNVYSIGNHVNVVNRNNLLVKEIYIYDVLGQEVGKFAINSTDNILINTNLTIGNYVVKLITAEQVGTYKLFIK